jgi:RHS repeat-associated protein
MKQQPINMLVFTNPLVGKDSSYVGYKNYELSNHLGNVLTTVRDVVNGDAANGYWADVSSIADYSPFGVQLDGRMQNAGGYRYGFNGMEGDNEIKGEKNSYDFGNRIYDPRVARFLSQDKFTSKFSYQSPYIFAGNTPIMGVDVNGDSLYVLTYTVGNSRGDEMFKNAALTRQYDIEHSGYFDPARDKVVLLAVSDMAKVKNQVETTIAENSGTYGKTVEFGMWSHAGVDGPTGTAPTSSNALDGKQMTLDGWSKTNYNWAENARAGFYGCKTGVDPEGDKKSFSSEISGLQNFKDVTVFGQTNSAFPSMYTNYRNDKGRGDNHSLYVLDEIVMIQQKNTLDRAPVMPSMIDRVNSTYKVQKTYMVGGYGRSQDWNLNEQNVSLPMRKSKNGWGTVGTSQTGDTKP